MKKTMQFVMVLMVATSMLFTQYAQSQISYGVKGGLNLATVGGSDVRDADTRMGFHAGGFLGLSLLGLAAFEGGVYFSQKGNVESGLADIEVISTYIDIPIVAKISFLPFTHIFAGPQFSFLLNSKVSYPDGDLDISDLTNSTDLAAVVGLGMNLPMGLRLSAGYDFGLVSVDAVDESKVYNRVIKLTVGYKF